MFRIFMGEFPKADRRHKVGYEIKYISKTGNKTGELSQCDPCFCHSVFFSKVEVPTIVHEPLEDYLSAHSPVPPPKMGRWISI